MLNKDKVLFLIGGHDLEMLEIEKILADEKYIDKNLSWGAALSSYEDYLSFDGTIYGIELEENITPPKNYIEIDHHNNNSHKPSSLEQVAELLNIELNRHQLLVAKNDSNYINGMKSICATQEEIEYIRSLDRKAQGITVEDERLAELSIKDSNHSNIIYSKTDRFTAISDKVYDKFENYIIYNDLTLSFYGYKITNIIEFLKHNKLNESDFYYGGGKFGFIGIKTKIFSKEEIENLIKEFKKLEAAKEIISHHTFMLPFIFDKKVKTSIIKDWQYKPCEYNYNEDAYFHSFFKKTMFTSNEDDNSSFYTKEDYKNSEFIICKSKEYKLNLKSINLRIFSTGVAILSFHLENRLYKEIKDILEINDYGRRIYPEYLDEKLQCSLVPNYIKFGEITENFNYEAKPKKIEISKIIQKFLPIDIIRPAVDDRMFVISFYKNTNLANALKSKYKKNDDWYKYVYIDGNDKTVQNEEMQTELITKASYPRWQGYGTMFGLSKYSFVCLAEDSDFIQDTVEKHMQTMYFQMFSLLLMLRATILKFSSEVSKIANHLDKDDIAIEVESVYRRYIKFVNSFYFREITAKDQGLEIYEKSLGILNIQRDIKDLDDEIEELHKFVEMMAEKKSTEALNFISYIGGALLPASLVTSFLGMNYLDGIGTYLPTLLTENKGITSSLVVVASALVIPIYLKIFKGKK